MGTSYSHLANPEDDIRLITIQPGKFEDRIECHLKTHALSSGPSYEALSYTWGAQINSEKIIVNNQQFKVTANLFQALQHLRSVTEPRKLWIDAICINQKDGDERSSQVLRMRDIFKYPKRVIVWLGVAGDNSDVAMDWLKDFWRNTDPQTVGGDIIYYASIKRYIKDIPDPDYAKTWIALKALFYRDYWDRMWVIQELAVASDVMIHCGTKTIPWAAVVEASRILAFVSERSKIRHEVPKSLRTINVFNPAMNANSLQRTLSIPKTPYWFYLTLDMYRSSKAKDPRDKVYALLGFLENSGTTYRDVIRVDYKNRKTLDVYTDVVEFCTQQSRTNKDWLQVPEIEQSKYRAGIITIGVKQLERSSRASGPLNILCASQLILGLDYGRDLDFPSWLPDWRTSYGQATIDTISNNRFCASGKEHVWPTFSEDRRIITVQGFEIATVQHLAGLSENCAKVIVDTTLDKRVFLDWAKEWVDLVHKIGVCSDSEMQRFWRTLVLDSQYDGWQNEAPDVWYDMTFAHLEESLENSLLTDEAAYLETLVRAGRLRQFAVSSKAHHMMVPLGTEPGDSVFILLGCDVPVILRRDGARWRWLGECFCWGVMNGELVGSDDDWKRNVQELSLY